MIEKCITVENETGIHARPAGLIVREASKFKSGITFVKGSKVYNAKSVMSVMTMAADKGEEIVIRVDGPDEEAALAAMVNLIKTGLE